MKKLAALFLALGFGASWIFFHLPGKNSGEPGAEFGVPPSGGRSKAPPEGGTPSANSGINSHYAPHPSERSKLARDETAELVRAIQFALESGDAAARDAARTNLLPALIALDPVAAGRLAEDTANKSDREELLRRVAHGWSERDPTAALNWAEQLPDADERKSVLTDVAFQVAQSDPARAIHIAERYELRDAGGSVLAPLAGQWAQSDFDSALVWATARPAGEERNQIIARVAFVASRTRPADAADLVIAQMPPGPGQEEAAISVLHQWTQQDPAGAAAWVEQFPQGPLKERAQAEVDGSALYLHASIEPSPEPVVP